MKYLKWILILVVFFGINNFGQTKKRETETQVVIVIVHAHMDPVYRWRWNEIRDREISNVFVGVVKALDKYPELHFAQSSMLYYETQKNFYKVFSEINKIIDFRRIN